MAYKNKKKVLKARYKMAEAVIDALEENIRQTKKALTHAKGHQNVFTKDHVNKLQGKVNADREKERNANIKAAKADHQAIVKFHKGAPGRTRPSIEDRSAQEGERGVQRNPELMRQMLTGKRSTPKKP